MKKGCFITAVVVTTILVGAALYIFQNHFESLVLNPGKKFLAGFVKDELEKKMAFVYESPEKRKLKKLIKNYSENTDIIKKLKEKDVDSIVNRIDLAISDSVIQKSELDEISQLLESKLK